MHGIIREQTELLYEAFITNLMCLINVLDYLNMCLIKHSEQKSVPWWFGYLPEVNNEKNAYEN